MSKPGGDPLHSGEMAETTALSLGLGVILAIVMGAANVYLGLKVGMTVSASIPAAVISMAILRGVFKRGTVLENNITQTVASTGESLAAGAIFTLPALLLSGVWDSFNYWIGTGIIMAGGLLGIVFMVPLRKALIVDRSDLRYPEGVACAEVLQAGQKGGAGIRGIIVGLGVGAGFKLLSTGLGLLRGTVEGAFAMGGRVFYFGSDLSPALLAVGYIVGVGIASQIFLGGVIGWMIAIPLAGPSFDTSDGPALERAWALWSSQIRYLGVGAMLVGGLYSIWNVRDGLVAGIQSLRMVSSSSADLPTTPRTERNMSSRALAGIFAFSVILTFLLYEFMIGSNLLATAATAVMIPAAFLFAAVATYIVGLVGSSNSPVSGMTICALLLAVLIIWAAGGQGDAAILATLGVAGVVCCVACTAGDVAQDLKTGQLVGATPSRQQWAEVLGVVVPALCMVPILALLEHAYGIGGKGLQAPQATLFASLAKGFFGGGSLPYPMIVAGLGVGVTIVALDNTLEKFGYAFRLHIMPIAVGIYLPLSLSVPIMIGGALHYVIARTWNDADGATSSGILFGSGLIAGEALMGIGLAIPLALGATLSLGIATPTAFSLLAFAAVIAYFAHSARQRSE